MLYYPLDVLLSRPTTTGERPWPYRPHTALPGLVVDVLLYAVARTLTCWALGWPPVVTGHIVSTAGGFAIVRTTLAVYDWWHSETAALK